MKKFLAIVLVCFSVCLLFGCGSDKNESVIEAYRNSAQILLDQGDLSSAIDLLTHAVSETGDTTLTAMLEEAISLRAQSAESQPGTQEPVSETETPSTPEEPVTVDVRVTDVYNDGVSTLPQIELTQENILAINREIYDNYTPMAENGCSFSYDWYVNGDLLSLVIRGMGDSYEFYTVYNVSVTSGESLNKEAVLSAAGLDLNAYRTVAKDCLSSYFHECNSAFASEANFSSKLEDTVSDGNIDASQVFLGEGGALYAVAYVGSFVGADGYDRIVEITH